MCAIGRNLDTSVGANSPATAMLGTGAIGTSSIGRRGTLLTGAPGRQTAGGTLLTTPGGTGELPGGSANPNKPQRER